MARKHKDSDPVFRFPPKVILVPVDFSEVSRAALAAAKALAARWGARLDIVHVDHSMPHSIADDLQTPKDRKLMREFAARLEAKVRALAEGCPRATARIIEGFPKTALPELARPGLADLVVMGSRGHGAVAHVFLGSTAETMVNASKVPVLTVHGAPPEGWPRNALVPMKPSRYAESALLYAARLCEETGARLSIMHAAAQLKDEDDAWRAIDEFLPRLLGPDRAASTGRVVAVGPAAKLILRAAEKEGFDLIVLAAHRKPLWESLVVGTTAERVLRHARVPVLSIPSEAPAGAAAEAEEESAFKVWK